MELLIKIPKEFEQHFKQDAFEDSLHRLSADAHLIAGNYEQETAIMLIEAFKHAVSVPTHGRLIDADALYPIYADLLDGGDVKAVVPKSVIDTSPTIIEAEEEE